MSAKKNLTPMSGQKRLTSFFTRKPSDAASPNPNTTPARALTSTPTSAAQKRPFTTARNRRDEPESQSEKGEKKRRRVILSDGEDEEERPVAAPSAKKKADKSDSEFEPSDDDGAETENDKSFQKTPTRTPKSARPSGISEGSRSFLSALSASPAPASPSVALGAAAYEHHDLDFLRPDRIKDFEKRDPADPDYDPATLHVPKAFIDKKSPGMQQWWRLKAHHFDTVLFFKVGKFYELYHMDAELAVRELSLSFMRGAFAHCGFPEMAEGRMRDELVRRGYRVARVEQTETPAMLERRRSVGGGPKVVARELCRVTTPGTRGNDSGISPKFEGAASNLIAVLEAQGELGGARLGLCMVNTQTGLFTVAEMEDDAQRSRLRTLLARHPPAEILHSRNPRPSPVTAAILRNSLAVSGLVQTEIY